MELTLFDILAIVFLIGGGIWGALTGAVRVVAPSAFILAIVTFARIYPYISAHFGTTPIHFFLLALLAGFAVLLLFGLLTRALHGAIHAAGLGPLNRLLGIGLGLFTAAVVASAVVWWIQTHAEQHLNSLLSGSVLAPALREFFDTIVALTERLLPPSPAKPEAPWWRRTLW